MAGVQTVVDTALAANAVALGNGAATENFRESIRNILKINIAVTPELRRYLERFIGFPVIFTNAQNMSSDHLGMAVLRQLNRDCYERTFHISSLKSRALVVGAAGREISLYFSNPFFHFYIHAGENKDIERVVLPIMNKISAKLKQKALKTDKRVFCSKPEDVDSTKLRGAAKRYNDMQILIKDMVDLHKLPSNIHTEPVEANILLFEDSLYNLNAEDLVKLFVRTNASVAYGYGAYPMELLFPDMPPNRLYKFARYGEYAQLTYRNGTSNGYSRA